MTTAHENHIANLMLMIRGAEFTEQEANRIIGAVQARIVAPAPVSIPFPDPEGISAIAGIILDGHDPEEVIDTTVEFGLQSVHSLHAHGPFQPGETTIPRPARIKFSAKTDDGTFASFEILYRPIADMTSAELTKLRYRAEDLGAAAVAATADQLLTARQNATPPRPVRDSPQA